MDGRAIILPLLIGILLADNTGKKKAQNDEKIVVLEKKLASLAAELDKLKERISSTETCRCDNSPHQELSREFRLLSGTDSSSQTSPIIAFSAVLTNQVILGELQEIKYDKVLLNIGNGYDPRYGHFTAPIKGLYFISFTTMKNHIAETLYVELVKDGIQLVANVGSTTEYNVGTHALPVVMEKGEMVWVRHYKLKTPATVQAELDEPMCSFSGVLLFKM